MSCLLAAAVISFYRRLGYTETEPFETESPVPMTYMERAVTVGRDGA